HDRVTGYAGRLLETVAGRGAADPELQALVTRYDDAVDAEFGQVIGELTEPWHRRGGGESNVGDWICDRMLEAAGADVALLNSGTLRRNFQAGPLTRLDIHQLLPFGNLLETFQVDGRGLERICLANARNAVEDRHGILQVGGLRYAYAVNGGEVELREVTVGGQPLDPDRVYTVACPDYVAMKARLYMDMDKPVTRSAGVTVTDAIIHAVEASGPIAATIDGRIAQR
ncbi:5'-nucleotidase C-terminal domain-containing protein, partial [bacterium]|nr:5'-nucleotidase C-terminal domain-containing protein [bacterium]